MFRERDEDSDLLIADFGLSRIIDTDKFHTLKTTCGTPGYMVKFQFFVIQDLRTKMFFIL